MRGLSWDHLSLLLNDAGLILSAVLSITGWNEIGSCSRITFNVECAAASVDPQR